MHGDPSSDARQTLAANFSVFLRLCEDFVLHDTEAHRDADGSDSSDSSDGDGANTNEAVYVAPLPVLRRGGGDDDRWTDFRLASWLLDLADRLYFDGGGPPADTATLGHVGRIAVRLSIAMLRDIDNQFPPDADDAGGSTSYSLRAALLRHEPPPQFQEASETVLYRTVYEHLTGILGTRPQVPGGCQGEGCCDAGSDGVAHRGCGVLCPIGDL